MSRKRHRNRGNISTFHQPVPVESLISAGKWDEAASAIQAQLAVNPTDESRRKLANCLLHLADYKAAASLWQSTSVRLYDDRLFAGQCLCIATEWEAARAVLESCVKEREQAEALYWLACSVAQGKRDRYSLNGTSEKVRELLTKARSTSCSIPDVYLWLFELVPDRFSDGTPDSLQILKDGIAANPGNWQMREILSERLCYVSPDDALYFLGPILTHDAPSKRALWLAKSCEERKGNLARALSYFDRSLGTLDDDPNAPGHRLYRGDLLVNMGRHQQAITEFRSELAKPNPRSKCLASVALAYAHAKDGKIFQAWTYARNAVDLWLEGTTGLISYYDIFSARTEDINVHRELPGHICELPGLLEPHAAESDDFQTLKLLKYWSALWRSDLDDCLAAALHLPPKKFHFANLDWSIIAARDGDVLRALRHYLTFAEKCGSPPTEDYPFRPGFYDDEKFNWEHCFKNEAVRTKVDTALFDFTVKHQKNVDLVECMVVPLYQKLWRKLLWDRKSWQRIFEVAGFLQGTVPDSSGELFDYAYAAHELKKDDEAEKSYRKLLVVNPKHSAALHNLSMLVQATNFDESLDLQRRAAESNPENENMQNRLRDLQAEVVRRAAEARRHDEFLKTARDRWPQIDYFKKKLLGALTIIETGFDDWTHLARLTGIDEKYLPGHWRKLVDDGFIIENASGYELNEHVLDLIKQERSHAVTTTIIRADATIAFKPVFNSKREYEIYHILIALFPNHFVLPNISLQTIFQYDRMKELLEPSDFDYFLKSQVDFCITSTANYLPLIAFEIDSAYHDDEKQTVRDHRKNRIFQRGGINLLRLRPYGRPSEAGLRSEVVKVVNQFGKELRSTAEKTEGLTRITLEIDFEAFGFENFTNDDS